MQFETRIILAQPRGRDRTKDFDLERGARIVRVVNIVTLFCVSQFLVKSGIFTPSLVANPPLREVGKVS